MEKKLKVILIVLLMILIIIVGFGGIYVKNKVTYNSILPDYELGTGLTGSRITTLIVEDGTREVIYDKEGKEVEEIPEGEDESLYTKENVPVNNEESKNAENYKKVKRIITKRLKALGIANHDVRVNEENGTVSIEMEENDYTNTALSYLLEKGNFEIVDSENKNVLMTHDDIKEAGVFYSQGASGGIIVYLDIEFTKEGKAKIEQISKDYATVKEEKKTEEAEENSTENTENESTEEKIQQKEITVNINGTEFMTTSFEEPITQGKLTISMGNETTNTDDLNETAEHANHYAAILNNGAMPLTYEVESSEYIQSEFSKKEYQYIIIGIIMILVVLSIVYMSIRYKKLGILSSLIYLATIALLLIIARYIKADITLETMISALVLVLVNTFINCNALGTINKEDKLEDRNVKLRKEYVKAIDLLIIVLMPAVVFTYNVNVAISSIGIVLFWGIVCIITMNLLFTRKLLLIDVKK